MEMQSNFQPLTASLMSRTARAAVMEGPETNLVGSFWPVMRSFTWVPPTSMTRTLGSTLGSALGFFLRSLDADGLAIIYFLRRGWLKVSRRVAGVKRGNGRGGRKKRGGSRKNTEERSLNQRRYRSTIRPGLQEILSSDNSRR